MENQKSKCSPWLEFDSFPVRTVMFCVHYLGVLLIFVAAICLFLGFGFWDCDSLLCASFFFGCFSSLVSAVILMVLEVLCRAAVRWLELHPTSLKTENKKS